MLRPGGRFAVSDVIADPDMDEQTRADMAAWTGCIAGALTEAEFRDALAGGGLRGHRDPRDPPRPRARRRRDHPRPQAGPRMTSSGRTKRATIQLNDPETLYRRWEEHAVVPFTIDLSTDRSQWPTPGPEPTGLLLCALSSLMVAEERITTKFCWIGRRAGNEEEVTFLATQQVDEARHMQFYARFQDEVIAAPDLIGAHVQRAREHVSESFRQIFDVALVNAHERLTAAPDDLAAKVSFVTLYHLVLESTLGLTTFKFLTDYLAENELLPGFVDGYSQDPPRRDPPHRLRRLVPTRNDPRAPRDGRRRPTYAPRTAAVSRSNHSNRPTTPPNQCSASRRTASGSSPSVVSRAAWRSSACPSARSEPAGPRRGSWA